MMYNSIMKSIQITVDDDLLSLGRHRETVIVRPAAFWKLAPPPTRPAR